MSITTLQKQQELLKVQMKTSRWIKRDMFAFAKKQMAHDLIKVVSGPRRVGKSTLCLQLLKGTDFGYVNFDDPDLDLNHLDFSQLTKHIDKVYHQPKTILFDEIQNLPKWEIYLNSLQRQKRNLLVTGSNARLLSKDLATALTGRAIEISVLPFSFTEGLEAKNNLTFDDYLLKGHYPEVLVKQIEPELYYQSLFNTSLIKDVVVRYGLRNPIDLENVAKYLSSIITNAYSYQNIAQKLDISTPTIIDYLNHLEETFIFFQLPRFSTKQSEITRANKKIYTIDFALAKYNSLSLTQNYGYALENAVFVEFLRRDYLPGRTLFYYKNDKNQEIDFVLVEKDRTISLYQVCFSVADDKTLAREVTGLLECSKALPRVKNLCLVTKDIYEGKKVPDVHIVDFISWIKGVKEEI